MEFALIIPSAGSGSRSGQQIPKQYVEILGRRVLAHTLGAFAVLPECIEIIVAIDEAWRDVAENCAKGIDRVAFVTGGIDRQDSISNALSHIQSSVELVLVHDAARPCVTRQVIERVVEMATRTGGAIPALPINETVKRVDSAGLIIETLTRAELRAAQTPQGFRRDLLLRAYQHAVSEGATATDDASLVEAYGAEVSIVEGSWENIKITLPEDFKRAEEILSQRQPLPS